MTHVLPGRPGPSRTYHLLELEPRVLGAAHFRRVCSTSFPVGHHARGDIVVGQVGGGHQDAHGGERVPRPWFESTSWTANCRPGSHTAPTILVVGHHIAEAQRSGVDRKPDWLEDSSPSAMPDPVPLGRDPVQQLFGRQLTSVARGSTAMSSRRSAPASRRCANTHVLAFHGCSPRDRSMPEPGRSPRISHLVDLAHRLQQRRSAVRDARPRRPGHATRAQAFA